MCVCVCVRRSVQSGETDNMSSCQQGVVKEYVDTLSFDKLPSLMEFLHGLLTTPDNGHLVIYTHCEVCGGSDNMCLCVCVPIRLCAYMCVCAYLYMCMDICSRVSW